MCGRRVSCARQLCAVIGGLSLWGVEQAIYDAAAAALPQHRDCPAHSASTITPLTGSSTETLFSLSQNHTHTPTYTKYSTLDTGTDLCNHKDTVKSLNIKTNNIFHGNWPQDVCSKFFKVQYEASHWMLDQTEIWEIWRPSLVHIL